MFCEQCEQTASGQGCHQWGKHKLVVRALALIF
jgi:hypothetical protein